MNNDQPRALRARGHVPEAGPTDREIEIRLRLLEAASRLVGPLDPASGPIMAPADVIAETAIRVAGYWEHFVYEGWVDRPSYKHPKAVPEDSDWRR